MYINYNLTTNQPVHSKTLVGSDAPTRGNPQVTPEPLSPFLFVFLFYGCMVCVRRWVCVHQSNQTFQKPLLVVTRQQGATPRSPQSPLVLLMFFCACVSVRGCIFRFLYIFIAFLVLSFFACVFFRVEVHFISLRNIVARHIREDRSSITNQQISKTPVGSDAPTGGNPPSHPSPLP